MKLSKVDFIGQSKNLYLNQGISLKVLKFVITHQIFKPNVSIL